MGSDLKNITSLATQVRDLSTYRNELYDYLKKRMMAIAPNLTLMVGELVGARLLAHAGSLVSLAKYPASTVQLLGAEKALFKALKTKHDTPKYGLIYHAQLVGQAATSLKGKVSRMLAAKASLACRVDAFSEDTTSSVELGMEQRLKVEARINQLEGGNKYRISGTGKQAAKFDKYEAKGEISQYKAAADNTMAVPPKRKLIEEISGDAETQNAPVLDTTSEQPKKKKKKKEKDSEAQPTQESVPVPEVVTESGDGEQPKKKKKKNKDKDKAQLVNGAGTDTTAEETEEPKKKKKKKDKSE